MEPRAYFDPPSEREWTIAEQEEFYAGQDAITGLSNGTKPSGIRIKHIVSPTSGWPIAMHCPICKETTFILSQWAIKPESGDYFKMNNTCGSDALGSTHNLILARDTISEKLMMRPLPMNGFGE